MLPSLIKKVVKIVETRLVVNGCLKCERKDTNK
jgi:hypothetical protein